MEGAYLGEDGRVHIPGKRVTLYSDPSPPQPDKLVCTPCRCILQDLIFNISLICFQRVPKVLEAEKGNHTTPDTSSDSGTEV